MISAVVAERFWAKVQSSESGCWLWTGAKGPTGYGIVNVGGRVTRRAHRVAFEVAYGAVPNGLYVCHRCNKKSCVRPSHLYAGTQLDNMRDLRESGVSRMSNGDHNRQKLQCPHGHYYSPENTRLLKPRKEGNAPFRVCRICTRIRGARVSRATVAAGFAVQRNCEIHRADAPEY